MSHFRIVIPARYASSRLPGKPLLDLAGKPMIVHVVERAQACGARQVIVATDDQRIQKVLEDLDVTVCMTGSHHQSGTERLAEVVQQLQIPEHDIIVNLQGDEPLMPSICLNQVANALIANSDCEMSTLATPILEVEDLFDWHVVKVVTDKHDNAMYFSRATIPWNRDEFQNRPGSMPEPAVYLRHIGLYAYRAGFINKYLQMQPSPLESIESLEQLRVLWHGHTIKVVIAAETPGHGVDTAADLQRVARLLQ